MFQSLSDKLNAAFKKFRSKGKLTEADIKAGMREIKLALLEADVNFKVVREFVKVVSERAVGSEVLESLLPGQQIVKIVNEELTNIMGKTQSKLTIAPMPPTVIMMVGLQGAGKTTHAGKLAGISDSMLLIGPPGSGKTTLLRDLIRMKGCEGDGCVAVVDEREELFPHFKGQACFDPGIHTDVLSGCPKSDGIDALLRSMNPSWIAVDEITREADCNSLLKAGWCGVRFIVTAHAGSVKDLLSRPVYRPLIINKLFDSVVVLRRDKSWTLERMHE